MHEAEKKVIHSLNEHVSSNFSFTRLCYATSYLLSLTGIVAVHLCSIKHWGRMVWIAFHETVSTLVISVETTSTRLLFFSRCV